MIVCRIFGQRQQALHFGESRLRLLGDGGTFANLAGKIDGVAVDDGAAHAGARLDTLDGHGEYSCWT